MEAGTLEDYSFQNKIMELDHNLCGMAGLGMVSTEANARSHSEINQAVMHFDSDQSTDPEQLEIEMIDECEAAILPSQPRISFSSASFSSNPAPLCDSSLFKTGSSFEGTLPASKILTDTTTLSPFLSGDENFTFSRCCEPLNSEVYLPEPKEHLQLFAEVIELTSTSATEPADELRHSELPDRMEDEGLSSASNEQESLELINTSEDLSSETCAKLDESLNQSLNLKTPAEEVEPFLSKSSLQSALSDLNSAAENLPSSGSEGETVHQPFYDDHDAFKCSRVNDGNSKLDQMSCNLAEDLPYIDDEYDSRPKPRVDLLESIEVVDPGMYLPGDEWVEADGNRAPPVRLICEGCEYSLFRRIEPPVTFQAEAAAPISPSDDQTVLLSEVEYRDLYYGPIETFIQSLHRIFPNLNADHNEFVLNFPDLEIKITEDNIYTKELSIFDFDRLHAGGKLPDRLLICLEKQPRLVHCFNVLAAYVNGLSNGEIVNNEEAIHYVSTESVDNQAHEARPADSFSEALELPQPPSASKEVYRDFEAPKTCHGELETASATVISSLALPHEGEKSGNYEKSIESIRDHVLDKDVMSSKAGVVSDSQPNRTFAFDSTVAGPVLEQEALCLKVTDPVFKSSDTMAHSVVSRDQEDSVDITLSTSDQLEGNPSSITSDALKTFPPPKDERPEADNELEKVQDDLSEGEIREDEEFLGDLVHETSSSQIGHLVPQTSFIPSVSYRDVVALTDGAALAETKSLLSESKEVAQVGSLSSENKLEYAGQTKGYTAAGLIRKRSHEKTSDLTCSEPQLIESEAKKFKVL